MNDRRSRTIKLSIIFLWIALFLALVGRELFVPEISTENNPALLDKSRRVHYYGVWFENRRIGYVMEELTPEDPGFHLTQEAFLQLHILDTDQAVHMALHANLDQNLLLQKFRFSFDSPFYVMKANGHVQQSTVHFTLDTGQTVVQDSVTLDRAPGLEMNERAYLLRSLPQKGDRARKVSFDPLSLTGKNTTIEYMGRDKQLIDNRVYNLHHFTSTYSGVRVHFWLNDKGLVVKEQSASGFTFLAEPKFKAMEVAANTGDLLRSVSVAYTGQPPGADATAVSYRLHLPEDVHYDLDGGRQRFSDPTVTLSLETIPRSIDATVPAVPCDEYHTVKADAYVQADSPEIGQMARRIIGTEKNRVEQVRLLVSWVYKNLEKRPVIGLPDALTTLHTRRGDCNEHAALFAALARSAGIPTSIATGVTLFRRAFYYHAWNEVCLDGQSISVDTTNNQFPADLTHIRFASGGMEQQIKIGSLLGTLKIDILSEPEENTSTGEPPQGTIR